MAYNQNQYQYKAQSIPPPPPYPDQHQQNYLFAGDEKHLYNSQTLSPSRSTSPLPPATPHRGSQESSADGSDYGAEIKQLMNNTSAHHVYDVLHTKSHVNMRVVDAATHQPIYYVDNSPFTVGKPDVTLCRGADKTDPVIGVARWSHMYSKHLTTGVGDPSADATNVRWVEVASQSMRHPEWKWSVVGSDEQRHTFAWSRMSGDDAVDAGGQGTNKMSFKNYKLMYVGEAGSAGAELLATFSSNRMKSWSKLGKVIVRVDGVKMGWGQDWEVMVLLSVFGLVEMSRRRGRSRRSQGGSYGG